MGYMGLSHWGESDNAAGFKYQVEKSLQKLVNKELKNKANNFNTDGYINIALLLEDRVFSIQILSYDQALKLIGGLEENIEITDDKYHRDSCKRLLKFVKKEFDKYKDDLYV